MLYRVLSAIIIIAGVAGCATSRDVRKLQVQIDEIRATQQNMQARLAQIDSINTNEVSGTRAMTVDLKHSISDVTDRLDRIDARLSDLDQRVANPVSSTPSSPGVISQPQAPITPGGQPAATVPAGDRQDKYQAAYNAMGQEDYPTAIRLFREFVDADPQTPESGAAMYWIGESFAAAGQPDSAIAAFQKIVDMYPQNDKVPAALYRIGNLYEDKGDKKAAFPYYQRLRNEYPQSLEYQLLRKKLGE